MNYDEISSGINREKEGLDSLMEKAADYIRGVSRSIQDVAGTTACKGV